LKILLHLIVLLAAGFPAEARQVASPEQHLGRPLGRDFELADWQEVSSYYLRLAQESPRVLVESVGATTLGREFLLCAISSESNLARLEELREDARKLADPRGLDPKEKRRIIEQGRPILFISLGMHSTETAAPQFGMELAHRLATSDEEPYLSARERLVVLIAPCLNPDGLDEVVSWYRETVGTPYEGAQLLKLYQHYSGHDNNRDWFMLSQNETRIVTRLLYSVWRPQVYWDVHQQGRASERMFVPPFRDPLNPNLDPALIAGIDALGSRALFDMTAEGFSGISTGVTYDMWWNGGNRNVPVRHNIIGLLTEAASVNVASPVFFRRSDLSPPGEVAQYAPSHKFPKPWPGGWWRIRDIIDYEHAFARSLLGSLAREPSIWLSNSLRAAERNLDASAGVAPVAWMLPSDNRDRGAARRLAEALLLSGVELEVAKAPFQADGRDWPAGSIVIQRHQPYGDHVQDLFEIQRYPDGIPPYDTTGWTLPLLLGLRRVALISPFEAALEPVADAEQAVAGFPGRSTAGALDSGDSDGWKQVIAGLEQGQAFDFLTEGDQRGFFVTEPSEGPRGRIELRELPRIGLYSPWSGSMDEGWMRYLFDSFGLPYTVVRNEMIRAGQLGDFLDVLVLPSLGDRQLDRGRAPGSVPERYSGGLDPEGAAAVEEFVRSGGTLVAVGASAVWAAELCRLPVRDVTRDEDAGAFDCPGAVLRAVPAEQTWTAGLPGSVALFFSRSAAFEVDAERAEQQELQIDTLLRYAPTRTLLSGWIQAPDVIAGQGAWLRAAHGDGALHLFGFRPQYRSWSQGTFQLLFRAMLFESS